MKYLLLAVFLPFAVIADPRLDESICHFPIDITNADNEPEIYDCGATVKPDGNGNARGEVIVERLSRPAAGTVPLDEGKVVKLKGTETSGYDDFEVLDSQCAMVAKNYNAGAGNFTYTEYTTNDWNLIIKVISMSDGVANIRYELHCRNGTE